MHLDPSAEAPAVLSLAAMWLAMMVVMMTPAVWPWVTAFHRFGAAGSALDGRLLATATFVAGYLAAWAMYSVAAALMQTGLISLGAADAGRPLPALPAAAVLLFAGLFQFSRVKRACLAHCRSPFGYFLSRWRNGPSGGFRMGLGHGVYCVGCCWALMATSLAVGVMSRWWMAALAGAVFVEQVAPIGVRVRVWVGVALVVAALLVATGMHA